MDARSKRTFSHSRIRWIAIAMTAWAWVIEIVVLTKFRGQPLSHAATVAAVAALGGLITWAIYHATSRRDDGMAIFIRALGALNGQNSLSLRAAVVAQIASGVAALDGKGDGKADGTNIIALAVCRLEALSSSRSRDLFLPSPFSASLHARERFHAGMLTLLEAAPVGHF